MNWCSRPTPTAKRPSPQTGVVVDKNVDIKAGEPFSKSYAVTGDTTFKVKFTPDKTTLSARTKS